MVRSGIKCSDNIVDTFNKQKIRKTADYVLYKLSDDQKTIEVDQQAKGDWNSFVSTLTPDKCRYASVDFPYNNKSKLIFVAW